MENVTTYFFIFVDLNIFKAHEYIICLSTFCINFNNIGILLQFGLILASRESNTINKIIMPKLGIFFLFLIYFNAAQAKTIFVFNKKNQPVSNVKVSHTYRPYDSLKTDLITDKTGKVELPESDKRGLYFIHPKYNPTYIDGLQLKENDTITLTPSFLHRMITIR